MLLELLAGCSGLANREFVTDAVVLPQADQEELGFASVVEKTDRLGRRRERRDALWRPVATR